MNKKVLKLIAVSSTFLTMSAPMMTVVDNSPIMVAAAEQTSQKSVSMMVYKYSKNHKSHAKSMAQSFVGTKAQVTVSNGRVTKMTVHVDGSKSAMGKGQDVEKIVRSLKINGVNGHKENISADHSSFDFVFSGKAFKNNGWAKMNVTINFGSKMTEQAWVKFGKVSGLKTNQKKTKKTVKKSNKKVSKKSYRKNK